MLSYSKLRSHVMVATQNKYYGNVNPPNSQANNQPASLISTSSDYVPPLELTIKPPKDVIHKPSFNPRLRASQNYNVVEDLVESPSTMSTLEVLQNCPTQTKALFSAIGCMDPSLYPSASISARFYDSGHCPW